MPAPPATRHRDRHPLRALRPFAATLQQFLVQAHAEAGLVAGRYGTVNDLRLAQPQVVARLLPAVRHGLREIEAIGSDDQVQRPRLATAVRDHRHPVPARQFRPLGSAIGELLRKNIEADHTDIKPYVHIVPSPAQAHVYEAVLIGGDPPVKGRWRDGPMLREPGGARRRAPIVVRDRGAGHGASRTGATQMAASAPDAPDSVSSNAESGRRGRSSCAIIRCGG